MKVTVWGCRGSLPSPGPEKIKYGGNTSCVQVDYEDTCIILDGGSGIQRLGRHMSKGVKEIHLLLTHLHIDHTMGLGFFTPLYNPEVTLHIWGPKAYSESLLSRLRRYFSPPLFPMRLNELPVHPIIHELGNEEIQIGGVQVQSEYLCHPGPTLGFRLSTSDSSFCYIPDHEVALGSINFPHNKEWTSGYTIAKNADLLFHDGQFRTEDYQKRAGWGHSSIKDAIAFAEMCEVKKLALFHHDPSHTDDQLEEFFISETKGMTCDFEVHLCAEGNKYDLSK